MVHWIVLLVLVFAVLRNECLEGMVIVGFASGSGSRGLQRAPAVPDAREMRNAIQNNAAQTREERRGLENEDLERERELQVGNCRLEIEEGDEMNEVKEAVRRAVAVAVAGGVGKPLVCGCAIREGASRGQSS